MLYLTLDDCRRVVFTYIYSNLTAAEPAPNYEIEREGLAQLDKVLTLVRESYYPTPYDKAVYIVSGIAGSQYFSNGNKRLAVVTLLAFLLLNSAEVRQRSALEYQALLGARFPLHEWEPSKAIADPHVKKDLFNTWLKRSVG